MWIEDLLWLWIVMYVVSATTIILLTWRYDIGDLEHPFWGWLIGHILIIACMFSFITMSAAMLNLKPFSETLIYIILFVAFLVPMLIVWQFVKDN